MAGYKPTKIHLKRQGGGIVTEIWRPIPGYEKFYEASNLGRVRSLDRLVYRSMNHKRISKGQILKQVFLPNGYLKVVLYKDGFKFNKYVHRLISESFLFDKKSKSKKYVNHKNFIRSDNRLENLEWVTPRENALYSTLAGRTLKGERHPFSKLTESDIYEIRKLRRAGAYLKDIAKKMQISKGCIFKIVKYKTWAHIK
jgi:hypothetical protein